MPYRNGTGPFGQGPMTGRGLGYCAGYNSPGFTRGTPAGRFGYGRGFRRGFGRFGAPFTQQVQNEGTNEQDNGTQDNKASTELKEEIKALRSELERIEEKLKNLETK